MLTRRDFIKWSAIAGAWVYVGGATGCERLGGRSEAEAAKTLAPDSITKFTQPLLIPPVMPRAGRLDGATGPVDYYEVSVRQFRQQILPDELPETTVWGYGPVASDSPQGVMIHNAPSLTIEAEHGVPTRVKWINDLCDENGAHLPHLLPVDPTLHWANPIGKEQSRDTRPVFEETPGRYTGPVPLVTHVHGAVGVGDESDGYPEAWYLCDGPVVGYARNGTWYDFFAAKAKEGFGAEWGDGFAVFQYPNENRASTLWYHDHALGITRLNVYAGPAGFYILRGGDAGDEAVLDSRTGSQALLPSPAPKAGDPFPSESPYYEIPIAIQDRAFNEDGSLFYPGDRAYFDEIVGPFIPDGDFSPMWNPEFFGNTIMVNGNTWPFLEVEQRRYRFRFLNGCQSRFLILDFTDIPGARVWQIGNEGGFLAAPADINAAPFEGRLVVALAERADVIVDFTDVAEGEYVLRNVGPDEPFGGGVPGEDFEVSDPDTTGQIMRFDVVPPASPDESTPPEFLVLPDVEPLPKESVTRQLALIEIMGMGEDDDEEEVEGPAEAVLGTVEDGKAVPRDWGDELTETPEIGATELWEIYNTTADAHPIHVHETVFEVVDRQALEVEDDEVVQPFRTTGDPTRPLPHETGFKDTVIAYPGQVTRIRATFTRGGQYVWHCHILEHEDNEMMRPYRIGPAQEGQPARKPMLEPEPMNEEE